VDDIYATRAAATTRMECRDMEPEDDYDFLPTNHPRGRVGAAAPPQQMDHHVNHRRASPPANVDTIGLGAMDGKDDDEMSQMSTRTNALSIATASPVAKRHRTSPTTAAQSQPPPPRFLLQFTVPMDAVSTHIWSDLDKHLQGLGKVLDATSQLVFHPIHGDDSQKLTFMSFVDEALRNLVGAGLRDFLPVSHPVVPAAMPYQPHGAADINASKSEIKNCKFSRCPHFNFGIESFATDIAACDHGLTFHLDALRDLDNATLLSIGWERCSRVGCTTLGYGTAIMQEHLLGCKFPESIPPAQFSVEQESLLGVCPVARKDELRKLMNEGASLDTLRARLFEWMIGTKTAGADVNA
jgi:hypothetical protein